jgi:hypothetical protein
MCTILSARKLVVPLVTLFGRPVHLLATTVCETQIRLIVKDPFLYLNLILDRLCKGMISLMMW